MKHIIYIAIAWLVGCGARGEHAETTETVQAVAVNGSFETDYQGWTLLEAPSTAGTQCGTWGIATAGQVVSPSDLVFDFFDNVDNTQSSPGLPITYAATDGNKVALQLQGCPQNHRMFQTIALPACQPLLLWDMRYTNHNTAGFEPALQFTAVNIRDQSDTILATPFKTLPGDPVSLPAMTAFQVDLSAFSGQTIRLDFEHQVQQFFFDAAWDNIRVVCKALAAQPGALAFGDVNVGTSSTRTTTVTNHAATALTITATSASGPFAVTSGPALPITLQPGESTVFALIFQPVAAGPATGSFTLTSDDPNGATVVALSGNGLDGAKLTASPNMFSFGGVQVGETSAPQTIDLTNTGTSPLTISAASVAAPFTVDAPTLPITLAPNASTTVTIRFAPTSTGIFNGQLSIESNDPASPTLLSLSGLGTSPRLTFVPASVAFGNQRVGLASPARVVRARNDGDGPVTITGTTITGPFTHGAIALPITLAPTEFIDVSVTFRPTVMGAATGELRFASNATTVPIPLSGTGTQPLISVTPTTVNFGDQRTGTTGTRTVTVSNPGNENLVISSLQIQSSTAFSIVEAPPITIVPGASLSLTLRFTPPTAGNFNGGLSIGTNVPNNPITTILLMGRGIEPLLAVNPLSLAFGNQRVGTTSATKAVVISNPGTDTLAISSVTITAPFTRSQPPMLIPPGGSATIEVAFSPTALGMVSRDLTIVTNAGTRVVPCTGTGANPVVSASATSLAFGDVRTGTTSAGQSVAISNIGSSPLTISGATVSGPFTITSPSLPRSVLPGASVSFTVKFAPTANGAATGTLVITSDAAASPTQVTLTGTGVAPQLAVSAPMLDLGSVRIGSTSAAAGLSLQNSGSSPLTITSITISAPFARTAVTLPATIAPGGSLSLGVTFTPTVRALAAGALAIASDGGSLNVALSGRGIAPLIAASLDPVDFSSVAIGTPATRALQLTNTGDAPLAISTIAFAGAHAADYAIAALPTLPAAIAPGQSLALSIVFTPGDHGARSAQLIVMSDAFGTPQLVVGLAGAGEGARIAVSPTALDFGTANVGATSAPRLVTISNHGETALDVSSIVIGGAQATDFASGAALPITIAPGASATAAFTFTPSAIGSRAATATIVSTDPLVPSSIVTLAGTGESAVLAVSPAALPFGAVRVGQSKVRSVTLTNIGTGSLSITTIALGGSDAADFALAPLALPIVLAPSASRIVNVTFNPTVVRDSSATLDVLSDEPVNGTVALPLTGSGVSPNVALTPGVVDFGGQLVGRPSARRDLKIRNSGGGPLGIVSLAITGAQAASFTLVSPPALPATIAPGAELVLSLRVAVTAIGSHAATIAIGTDAPDVPVASANLAALGISTALALTPSMIDFGTAHVLVATTPVPVTLTNLTGEPLTFVDGVLGGATPGDFTVSSIAGTVPAGGSVTAMVTYRAATATTSAATLTLQTTDPAIPEALVTLGGKAVSTFVSADRGELAFGEIQVGDRSGPKAVTLTNVTTAPIEIASITSTDGQFIVDATTATVTVAPGGNVTFTVTFAPVTSGPASSEVAIILAGSTSPELTVVVSGDGSAPSSGGCSTTAPGSSFALVLGLGLAWLLRRRRRAR
ncbi:MAG: choice-of-anchor D domain-containing protein [Deltaproteobacteria bacterium]|nr:choice-of-anchor D domain-containing protein [Deltaproteobacteria bacterium]